MSQRWPEGSELKLPSFIGIMCTGKHPEEERRGVASPLCSVAELQSLPLPSRNQAFFQPNCGREEPGFSNKFVVGTTGGFKVPYHFGFFVVLWVFFLGGGGGEGVE